MEIADILKILEIISFSLVGIAGIITALTHRNDPKLEEKKNLTNDFTAQVGATSTLVNSTKELVGISQLLIKAIEAEKLEIEAERNSLKTRMTEIEARANECSRAIEKLQEDNKRLMTASRRLAAGIGILLSQLKSLNIQPLWTPSTETLQMIEMETELESIQKISDRRQVDRREHDNPE